MKKILLVLLAAMMAVSLISCGSSSESGSGETRETTTSKSSSSSGAEYFLEAFNTDPTIEEQVLWDENNVKVTATSLTYSNSSATLNLVLENYSGQELSFSCGTASYCWNEINGFMIRDGYIYTDVPAGESVEEELKFGTLNLQLYGINEIDYITFGIKVTDEDFQSFTLSPKKIETSAAASYDSGKDTYQEALQGGLYKSEAGYDTDLFSTDELYSKEGITLASEALMKNTEDESVSLFLEMRNQSERYVIVSVTDIEINGELMYDGTWESSEMNPDSRTVITVDVMRVLEYGEDTEQITMDEAETISFTVKVLNEDYQEALSPEEVTINIK